MEQARAQANDQQHSKPDQETRQRILQAAERLFLTRGFNGVSMKDIAEEVHVTSAALYYHFPEGKHELFINMIKMLSEEWCKEAQHIIAGNRNLQERLVRLAEYQMISMEKYEGTFAEVQRDLEHYGKIHQQKQDLFNHHFLPLQQLITDVFQQGIDKDEIAADVPPSVLAWIYIGTLAGIRFAKMSHPSGNNNLDTKMYASTFVSTLLDGMRHPKTT